MCKAARHAATVMATIAVAVMASACGSATSTSSHRAGTAASSPGGTSRTAASGSSASGRAAGSSGQASARLTVLAAASLTKVLPAIDPGPRYTFGGSGALETDIEEGAPADVFAAASPKQPAQLYAKGLVDRPVEFATNRLVLIVPKANPAHIASVSDITRPGVKLVICDATVPCGDYARNALKHLGMTNAAMKNVVSQTADVTQTVAEVALGQADAGFVYITDAKAADGKVAVVTLPAKAKPKAEDYIAVVKATHHPTAAKAFVARVLSPAGQAKLSGSGFGKP